MKEIIIHIGRHKTGTTSLQHFLALNDNILVNQCNLLYPESGRDQRLLNHHPIFRDVVVDDGEINMKLVKSILLEAEDKGVSRILLSSEILSRRTVTASQLIRIRDAFKDCQISIVVYLRRQDKFLQSAYAERVKRGFVASPDTIHDIDAALNYYKFIDKYADVYPPNTITVKSFEAAVKANLYSDFLSIFNINLSSDFQIPKKSSNERWPWLYIETIRYANSMKSVRKILTHHWIVGAAIKLNQMLPHMLDNPKPLSVEDSRRIMKKYYESNKAVAQKYLNKDELF